MSGRPRSAEEQPARFVAERVGDSSRIRDTSTGRALEGTYASHATAVQRAGWFTRRTRNVPVPNG